jgi:hypothetical protein
MKMPDLIRVSQHFQSAKLEDFEGTVRAELDGCGSVIRPGCRVAIAVGSRGIAGIDRIVRALVGWLKSKQADPFIVPAMGSHGGATGEGQKGVLAGYGVTEEGVGAPIRSSMAVVELPQGDAGTKVYFDQEARKADATILVNRVKVHTSFHGRYESGLMKMMAIGLGKHAQALAIHQLGVPGLREAMPRVARQVLQHANVVLGLAIVENARDETMLIRALRAADIPDQEPALLDIARANMPSLPVSELDVLIIDEIGKNISGVGLDTNVIGRLKIRGQPEPETPSFRFITIHDLSAGSHGNALGMGLADVTTRRLFEKIDFKATYANVLTSTFLERGKVPIIAETDRQAVEIALEACALPDPGKARIARIRNTLRLEQLQVSPAVLGEIEGLRDVEVVGSSGELFDSGGSLTAW